MFLLFTVDKFHEKNRNDRFIFLNCETFSSLFTLQTDGMPNIAIVNRCVSIITVLACVITTVVPDWIKQELVSDVLAKTIATQSYFFTHGLRDASL